jgi:RNA polymerase sigma-70 factor, ECF subfamily
MRPMLKMLWRVSNSSSRKLPKQCVKCVHDMGAAPLHYELFSDAALVALAVRRDKNGFAVLVKRHHRRCHNLAWRIVGNKDEVEDVVQEAFTKLWVNSEKYDASKGAFPAWIARIVTNCALDRRRMMKNLDSLEEAESVADNQPSAERLLEGKDVHSLLTQLPARQRAVLALFYMEGYSMSEIADIMETNAKAVESLLSRGREGFRRLFAEQGVK